MPAFLRTAADLPPGSGFALLGAAHLAWLAAVAAGVWLLCRFGGRRALRALPFALLGIELGKAAFLLWRGQFWAGCLPLFLCSMAMWLALADRLWHSPACWDILYGLCLPGAVGALLFPGWAAQPPASLLCAHSFIFHGLVVALILLGLRCGRRPRPRQGVRCCWAFLAVYAPAIKLLDGLLGTDFFFMEAGSPGSPLAALQAALGVLYLPVYLGLAALLPVGMYRLAARLWPA